MRKQDIEIGRSYLAKVSGKLVSVKILRASVYGGWDARNLTTGREIRIKTAGRLRRNTGEATQAAYASLEAAAGTTRERTYKSVESLFGL